MSEVNVLNEKGLNPRQEEFCKIYTSEEQFFGNGVQSYLEVFDIDKTKSNWYKTACSATSQLLGNIKVCKRINELLEAQGLNDEFIDKQLLFLATQHADFGNKLGAIREYNKLKARITEKIDHTTQGEKIYNWGNYGDNNIPPATLDKKASRKQSEMESDSGAQKEREDNSNS